MGTGGTRAASVGRNGPPSGLAWTRGPTPSVGNGSASGPGPWEGFPHLRESNIERAHFAGDHNRRPRLSKCYICRLLYPRSVRRRTLRRIGLTYPEGRPER